MRPTLLTLAAGCAGLMVAVEAAPEPPRPRPPATIGQFAARISTALGDEDPSPEAAARNLRARGVDLGDDLGAALTEGLAARVMTDLGYSVVRPADPSTPISESRAGFLAGTIATVGLPGGLEPEGIGPSATLLPILQCLQSPNSGLCTQCCLGLLPPRFPTGIGAQICTRICAFNTPPPSLSAPPS